MPLGYDVPFPVIPSQSADWRGNPSLCRGGRLCPPCMTNAATGKRIATPVTRSLVRNDSASRCRGQRPRRPTPQGRTTLSARVTGAGIRFFVLGRADCRVASRREASALGVLLAMTQCVGDGVLDVPFPVIPSQSADWRGNPSLCRGERLCPPSPANAQKDRHRRSFQRLSLNPSI